MATHFSVLAWKIPWTEERGRLQSIGLQRVEGFPGSSTGKKNLPAMRRSWFHSWVRKICWRMEYSLLYSWASPVAQLVKNLPIMWETWVQSLGRKDSLEKEMAIHSTILAWEIPCTEEPGWLQSVGWQRVGHDLATKQQQTEL